MDKIGLKVCEALRSRGLAVRQDRAFGRLPHAHRYFFTHYAFFVAQVRSRPRWNPASSTVYVTHLEPDKHGVSNTDLAQELAKAQRVICMNRAVADLLVALGLQSERVTVLPGAADRMLFSRSSRKADGYVGLCARYYPRKNPSLMLSVIKACPDKEFLLIGDRWDSWSGHDELSSCENLRIESAPYEQYPDLYQQMTVFLSVSELEGGPIPLIEAMMANVVPVVSKTGFAPDIIEHGITGFVFPLEATAEDIRTLIELAYSLDTDVASKTAHLDWSEFTHRACDLITAAL